MNVFHKCLSYLWDIRIEERSSAYNPLLLVFIAQGRYQLCTADAIYSHGDKYYNFKEILIKKIDYDKLSGKRALVLGLGMASIPIILDQMHPGQWDITGIEIDEEIIDLASIYALPYIRSQMNCIQANAEVYVDICNERYDIICVDLFIGQETPEVFKSRDFLERVDVLLNEGGIVVYNTIAFTKENLSVAQRFYDEVFRQVFPEGRSIPAHKNLMLLNR